MGRTHPKSAHVLLMVFGIFPIGVIMRGFGYKMNETNMTWKVSVASFQGYTKAKLENIGDDIKELKDFIIKFNDHMEIKITNQNKKINKINGKVAAIAATISALLSLTLLILSKLIG